MLIWLQTHGRSLVAAGFAALIIVVGVIFGYRQHDSDGPQKPRPLNVDRPTEATFLDLQDTKSVGGEVLAEWRRARGDHRIIAYAIAYCQRMRATFASIDTMPPHVFSGLMLDLTPIGEHTFASVSQQGVQLAAGTPALTQTENVPAAGSGEIGADEQKRDGRSDKTLELSGYQQAILFLSDAIGRARLAAASESANDKPDMRMLGWVSVVIGAIATLLVTIKSSMTAPQPNQKWMRVMFYGIGIIAIMLSGTVTALTSIKQFYDPSRSYKISNAALMELQRLHKTVALDFVGSSDDIKCNAGAVDNEKVAKWSKRLADLEGWVVMASANLQDIDITPLLEKSPPGGTGATNNNQTQEKSKKVEGAASSSSNSASAVR